MNRRRWATLLYAALAALFLVPFWAVPGYLPSTDGPSHVYNAWVLGQLAGPAPAPLLRQYYYLNPQPVPNSLTHVALLALMWALPPAAAEKVLLSLYVLLAAGALWYLAGAIDGDRAWLALLGLPFVWNVLLAARHEGYGGVLTTMAVAEEPRVKQLLGVPDRYAIAALVPLGKPVRRVTKLRRRPVAEFATRERFDGAPFTG